MASSSKEEKQQQKPPSPTIPFPQYDSSVDLLYTLPDFSFEGSDQYAPPSPPPRTSHQWPADNDWSVTDEWSETDDWATTNDWSTTNDDSTLPETMRRFLKSTPEPKGKGKAKETQRPSATAEQDDSRLPMSSLSSGLDSEPGDSEFITSLPVNAELSVTDKFADECRKEFENAQKAEKEKKQGGKVPQQVESLSSSKSPYGSQGQFRDQGQQQGSGFYHSPIDNGDAVKTNTKRGDFWSARDPPAVQPRLPVKGISRGLPPALANHFAARHGGKLAQVPGPSSDKDKAKEREEMQKRFHEDLAETKEIRGKKNEIAASDQSMFAFQNRVTTAMPGDTTMSSLDSVSMDLSKAQDEEEDLSGVSKHLQEVYQKSKKKRKNHRSKKKKKGSKDKVAGVESGDDSDDSDKHKDGRSTAVNNLSNAMQSSSLNKAAGSSRPLPRPPTRAAISDVTSSQNQMMLDSEQGRPHGYTNVLEQLQSEDKNKFLIQNPLLLGSSYQSRELWLETKDIHSRLSSLSLKEQRGELQALRLTVGMERKDMSRLLSSQVDAEYRSILNALERIWMPPRNTMKKSISTWIDGTQRATDASTSAMPLDSSRFDAGFDAGFDAAGSEQPTEKCSTLSANAGDESDREVSSKSDDEPGPRKPSLTRTSSGRVRLPVIASHNEPLTSPEKSALEHMKLRRYMRNNGTVAPKFTGLVGVSEKKDSHPPVVAGPGYMSPGKGRTSPFSSSSREARDVWGEARKRLRGLPDLPYHLQRLELSAMREAAGFADQESNFVADEDIVEVYKVEMKALEHMWLGSIRKAQQRPPVMGGFSTKKTTETTTETLTKGKGNGKESEVLVEKTTVKSTERMDGGKGKQREMAIQDDGERGLAIEDGSESGFQTTSYGSPPSTPTPTHKHPRRPARK